jgi:hypothetical protein
VKLIVCVCVILLCGCAPYRQINVGAAIPIYAANPAWMQHEYERRTGKPTGPLWGFCDRSVPEVFVSDALSKYMFAAVTLHECKHLEVQGEDPWAVADLTNAPTFPAMRDSE